MAVATSYRSFPFIALATLALVVACTEGTSETRDASDVDVDDAVSETGVDAPSDVEDSTAFPDHSGCSQDAECDDGDPCTDDVCLDHVCRNTLDPSLCCADDAACATTVAEPNVCLVARCVKDEATGIRSCRTVPVAETGTDWP